MNVLKVLAKYSAYIIGVLGLLYLACRNSTVFFSGEGKPLHEAAALLNNTTLNKESWAAFKEHLKNLRFLFSPVLGDPDTLGIVNEPILHFLAQFTASFGIGSLIFDTLGALGLNTTGIISGFEPVKSKIRHQVFKVLGKDTRESEGGNRKRTIKKN